MPVAKELQTLSRGLAALAFLNRNGLTDLATLARHLDIPRSNAFRILKTLKAAGYCTRIPNSRFYQVAPAVKQLSQGVRAGELLTAVSISIIEALGEAVKWPVALATPHGSEMLVRLTTDRTTSLALARLDPGYLAGMLRTTTGILYLALESPDVIRSILPDLRTSDGLRKANLSEPRLEELLEFARHNRYLIMDTSYPEGCIGVPIMHGGRPIGGVVMRYIRSAVSSRKAVETYLPMLRAAADEILRLYEVNLEASPTTL